MPTAHEMWARGGYALAISYCNTFNPLNVNK